MVAISTQDAKDVTRFGSLAESHVLTDQVSVSSQAAQNAAPGSNGQREPGPAAPVTPLAAQLSRIQGVQGCSSSAPTPG